MRQASIQQHAAFDTLDPIRRCYWKMGHAGAHLGMAAALPAATTRYLALRLGLPHTPETLLTASRNWA